jgi:hypothetical protein
MGAGVFAAMHAAGAAAVTSAGSAAAQITRQPPLPAKPPIGGPIWTIVVPAALLLVSIWGTWMLYRHFAKEE